MPAHLVDVVDREDRRMVQRRDGSCLLREAPDTAPADEAEDAVRFSVAPGSKCTAMRTLIVVQRAIGAVRASGATSSRLADSGTTSRKQVRGSPRDCHETVPGPYRVELFRDLF